MASNLHSQAVADEMDSRPVASAPVLRQGSYTNAQVTVGQDGTVQSVKKGPLSGITAPATTRNGNGTFVRTSDGIGGFLYEAWGIVTSIPSGDPNIPHTQAIIFPVAFPGTPVLTLTVGTYPDGVNEDCITAYHINADATGATAVLRTPVNIGGTGASSLTAIPIHWHARY